MSVTTGQATTLLENVLFEAPTVAAANAPSWAAQSGILGQDTVAGLAATMAASAEGQIAEQVVRYYMGALGRVPSGSEIQFYVTAAEQGLSAASLASGTSAVPWSTWTTIATYFTASAEFSQDYGLAAHGALDPANEGIVITAFYANILGRAPSSADIVFYENALSNGTTVPQLLQYFTTSAEYQNTVDAGVTTALASYGASVVNGNPPATIPYVVPGQILTETLGASALTVSGVAKSTAVTVTGSPAQSAQSALTAATGVIGVSPVTAATGVQGVAAVTGVTPQTAQAAQSAVTDGAVTVNDANSSATGTGSITSVTLIDSGAGSVINDNALTTLALTGTTGTLAITNLNSAAITAHSSTLALTLDGLNVPANTITDTSNEIATLTVATANHDSTLAGFADTALASLSVSGTNMLTLKSINASLISLTISGTAGFSDGASVHGTGLAARGSHLTITDTSTGSFTAALDDTTQTFTGTAGTDTITVSALADATQTITAGSATNNEIIFEGSGYALTSASTGKFVNFQTVGVAANVTGPIDLSLIDATASTLEVLGASTNAVFTKVATGAALLLDPSVGATVSVTYANSTGVSDSAGVTMSSAVTSLTLQDAANVGVGTVNLTNNLAATETDISAAHTITTLTDNGLSTLNVSGSAGLRITTLNENSTPATTFTLNNNSTEGNGVKITALTDTALTSLAFAGTGVSVVGALNPSGAAFSATNSGTTLADIDSITDGSLTSLTLAANVALGQLGTASTANGLQDSSSAGVTVSAGSDNAHVTVNLTSGAASGKTDSITLGNGNNIVVDASGAGTVNITLGTGANLVELGTGSLDTTAHYSVTLAARTATPPNVIYVGAAGTNYASAPNAVITGVTTGDIIAFGNDTSSLGTTLTATSLTSYASVATAIAALEALATQHKVVYGVYSGNTYIVESTTGIVGVTDTAVIEVTGSQTLTASTGYVTVGTGQSTLTGGGALSGSGFTIPAGTATAQPLGTNGSIVTLVGSTAGITDTFTSGANAGALTINYQATAASTGTDTIQMNGSTGANVSDISTLTVNDTSSGSAGVTIGAFTDNSLTSATYNNSAATGATMTQSALTSANLSNIYLTGGVALQNTNVYFLTANLTYSGSSGVTISDSNIGAGTTTMGLTLTNGPSALTLNMTGPGTLATGTLADDNLKALTIEGNGVGAVNLGALTDAYTGAFSVTDSDSSTSATAAIMILSGLSKATSLTITDSSTEALTDSSAYNDSQMTALTLTNSGTAGLTVGTGAGGIATSALSTLTITASGTSSTTVGQITTGALSGITIHGRGTGTITVGQFQDSGSAALAVSDDSTSTGSTTLDLSQISAAAKVTVTDSAAGALTLGNISDASATAMSFSNTGSSTLTVGTLAASGLTSLSGGLPALTFANSGSAILTVGDVSATALTSMSVTDSGSGALTLGNLTLTSATSLTFTNSGSNTLQVAGAIGGFITSNALTTLTISDGVSGTLTLGALTDDVATGFTIVDTSANINPFTLSVAAIPNASSITVTDSAKGSLTISGPFTDSDAVGTGALIFNNTGTATLTVSDLIDNGAIVDMAIEGTGTSVQAITLDNGGGAGSSFALTDSSSSSGLSTVTYDGSVTNGPASFSVADSAAGALTITAFTDNDLTTATLINSGSATLTVAGITNTTASGAGLFTTLTLGSSSSGGGGTITLTTLSLANDASTATLNDYQTGSVTIGTLSLGNAVTPTADLAINNINSASGSLTVGAGTVYASTITLENSSPTGTTSVILTDGAATPTTIKMDDVVGDTGAQSLTLTDIAGVVTFTAGDGNTTLSLQHDGISGDSITLGNGNNTITLLDSTKTATASLSFGTGSNIINLQTGHAVGSDTLTFKTVLTGSTNISPATADVINNYQWDNGTVAGDAITLSGFTTSASVITAAQANTYTATGVWTSSNGILNQSGASVINFITDVQQMTQASPGIAAFLDGRGNTWIAYNDGSHNVAVIELANMVATGLDLATGTLANGLIHIA